jgi:hypothetical protein
MIRACLIQPDVAPALLKPGGAPAPHLDPLNAEFHSPLLIATSSMAYIDLRVHLSIP